MPKRICIFVHYDHSDVVAPAVLHYLQGLAEICSEIVFVSNSCLSIVEQNNVSPLVSSILLRDNSGMDFGAWKYAIENLGWAYLQAFDELILANDSCYAPMFPFAEMFTAMSSNGIGSSENDFWGVTEHPAAVTRSGDLEAHLQSYFLVFSREVTASQVFQNFWQKVQADSTDYNKMVGEYESKLTPVLNKAGYSHKAYMSHTYSKVDVSGNWSNPLYVNRTIWRWRHLLQERSPFLKRKAFSFHFERIVRLIRSGYGPSVTKEAYIHTFFWRRCIEESNSNYPINIIREEIQAEHGDTWVSSSLIGKRIAFYLFTPLRLYKTIKRRARA